MLQVIKDIEWFLIFEILKNNMFCRQTSVFAQKTDSISQKLSSCFLSSSLQKIFTDSRLGGEELRLPKCPRCQTPSTGRPSQGRRSSGPRAAAPDQAGTGSGCPSR